MKESQSPKHARKIGGTPRRPRLLIATREGRIGGAERLILQSLPALEAEFAVTLTTSPLPWETPSPFPTRGETQDRLDPREILFGDVEIIYTHLFLPGVFARIRRLWDGDTRWVHAVHMANYDGLPLARLREWIDRRWVRPAADRIVAVSSTVAGQHPDPAQVTVLENALDLTPPPGEGGGLTAETEGHDRTPLRLVTVAMLRPEKGIDDLFRAVALLANQGLDPVLTVAGSGPMRVPLEALAGQLGIAERVRLPGFVPEVDEVYSAHPDAIYVQPSRSESFGLAALEAFRFGLPLVVAPVGHLPVLVGQGKWGFMAAADGPRPEALARAIEAVAKDRPIWAGRSREGRKHWAARLDPHLRSRGEVAILRQALLPRIVHVAPVATQGGGGLQRQVLLQTRALAARGHRVMLMQRPDPRFGQNPDLRNQWVHLTRWEVGTATLSGGGSRRRERLLGLRFLIAGSWRLWRERHRYDVVHAHQLYSPTLMGAVASLLTGARLVVRVTASGEAVGEISELARLPFRRLRWSLFGRIDRLVALSHPMRSELIRAGFDPERIVVVPNAVQLPDESLPQRGTQNEVLDQSCTLAFAGRFSREKGLDTLVDALGLLRSDGWQVRLRLIGRADPDRDVTPELRSQIRSRGLDDHLDWVGFTADMESEWTRSDAFVLPSRSEGMSNALLEAMAAGMTCLASDIPQNRALIRHGREGRLFAVGDATALAAQVVALIQDRARGGEQARAMADQAQRRIRTFHTPGSVAARISEVYRTITSP